VTYFYLALLSYGITFLGGLLLVSVVDNESWRDRFSYGIANSAIFGTALYIALILFTLP